MNVVPLDGPETFGTMRFTFLSVALLLVAGATALAMLPSVLARSSGSDATVFAVSATTAVGGAALLAWRDVYAFAVLASLMALAALAGVGLAWSAGSLTPGLLALTFAAAAVLVAGAGFVARCQLAKPSVPDVLAERFGRGAVYETSGVQLVVLAPLTNPANAIVPIELYLQNCTDAPRTVEVVLDDRPLFGRGGRIRWRKPPPVELAPGEVQLLRIPICAARADALSAEVHFVVAATGPRGRRIRPRRAPYAAPPMATWKLVAIALLALPLFVVVFWGRGGLKADVYFTPAEPLRTDDELPPATAEPVWQPQS